MLCILIVQVQDTLTGYIVISIACGWELETGTLLIKQHTNSVLHSLICCFTSVLSTCWQCSLYFAYLSVSLRGLIMHDMLIFNKQAEPCSFVLHGFNCDWKLAHPTKIKLTLENIIASFDLATEWILKWLVLFIMLPKYNMKCTWYMWNLFLCKYNFWHCYEIPCVTGLPL